MITFLQPRLELFRRECLNGLPSCRSRPVRKRRVVGGRGIWQRRKASHHLVLIELSSFRIVLVDDVNRSRRLGVRPDIDVDAIFVLALRANDVAVVRGHRDLPLVSGLVLPGTDRTSRILNVHGADARDVHALGLWWFRRDCRWLSRRLNPTDKRRVRRVNGGIGSLRFRERVLDLFLGESFVTNWRILLGEPAR